MKKNVLFALICASVFGITVSACSSDDGGIVDDASANTRASAKNVSGAKGEIYRVYTDYISDVNDEYGVMRADYFTSHMYIDAANGNRYYILPESDFPLDIESSLERLGFAEGNNVKFSGKVYDTDERWIPGLQWQLDNYGWNDGAKEAAGNGLYNFELPTFGQTFWLVTPDFTIEKAE